MQSEQNIKFGLFNNQTINNNTIVVNKEYLQHILTFPNNPSDLNKIVLGLYNSISVGNEEFEDWNLPPEIEDKLLHNNVSIFRECVITEYSENGHFLNQAYDALDSETPGRRKYFLKYINNIYRRFIGELLKNSPSINKMQIIRDNADNIISHVVNSLLISIAADTRLINEISKEIIEVNVLTIVCHAFIDCKILENPNQNNDITKRHITG